MRAAHSQPNQEAKKMSLRQLAREVVEASTTNDLDAMVDDLLNRVPDEELRAALRETLRTVIREAIHVQRNSTVPIAGRSAPASQGGDSWWVKGIREAHQGKLADLFHIGGGQWKRLAEMTYNDLTFAAEERRDNAKRSLAHADKLDTYAATVQRYGVDTFGDLPESELTELLEAAA